MSVIPHRKIRGVVFENFSRKLVFGYSLIRMTGTLHEDRGTVMISGLIIIIMRDISDKLKRRKMCFLSLSKKFVWNISHYNKNCRGMVVMVSGLIIIIMRDISDKLKTRKMCVFWVCLQSLSEISLIIIRIVGGRLLWYLA